MSRKIRVGWGGVTGKRTLYTGYKILLTAKINTLDDSSCPPSAHCTILDSR